MDGRRVGGVGREEDQVARLQVCNGDMSARVPLGAGVVTELDAGVRPREGRQPRATPCA